MKRYAQEKTEVVGDEKLKRIIVYEDKQSIPNPSYLIFRK
ncbi:hypothetical protein SAMN05192534_12339 [Alteribacillus persepolensis]|uniref:Uncharacterized protein n=1 Tax=Alteribacillus persepolensis TaxID=568899 RepID=A0A1G8I8L7_9BACI|nr:hypothetical protein SAMN05192534_12339 [Alteribacillus persepolensis]